MIEQESKSQGIQSIEVGMDILKRIAEAGRPVSITEIAILCETSKSKLHRYLTSFVRTGMLEKSSDAKYSLGTEVLRLGLRAVQKLNIRDVVGPHLTDIKEILNETAALAIWGQNGPFFVSWEESNHPVNIGIRVGSQVSVTRSAAGQVFVAYLPKEVTEESVNFELSKFSLSKEQLESAVEFVKSNHYSFVNSTILPGISAIAAPIFDSANKVVAALTIIGLEGSLDTSENSTAVHLLKERARIISEQIGWQGNF